MHSGQRRRRRPLLPEATRSPIGSGGTGLGPRALTQQPSEPVLNTGRAACDSFFSQQMSWEPSVDSTAAQHAGLRAQTSQHASASATPVEIQFVPTAKSSDGMKEQLGSAVAARRRCATGAAAGARATTIAASASLRAGPDNRPPLPPPASAAQSDGFGTSGLPLGSDVRRSTPPIQPLEGHDGHTGRDASSPTIVVMTNVA